MSSSQYLTKYRAALPTRQGNNILRLLTKKRDSGEIKTVDEFKQRLQELTTILIEETLKPTLSLYEAVAGEKASHEQYNEMIERMNDDLEAAFEEANNLDEILQAHHTLISKVALKALRYGVNELESKISLYEFLSKKKGFDDALFNTFRETKSSGTPRADSSGSLMYVDPRKNEVVDSSEDTFIDVVGERLLLGPDLSSYSKIRGAQWLSNSNSPRSELDASFPNSNINNITDNKNNTFWVEPLLFNDVISGGVSLEVALHFYSSQDVNFIEIEPATEFPLLLSAVDYIDGGNVRRSVDFTAIYLRGPVRVNIDRITTAILILRFTQENYKEIQFEKKLGESVFHRAVLGQNNLSTDVPSVSDDLRETLSSSFVMDVMNISNPTDSMKKYYEYLIGFDNIKPGFSTFDSRSIFVSKKKTVSSPSSVAIRVDEVRPVRNPGETTFVPTAFSYPSKTNAESVKEYHSSIEYYLGVQRFDDAGYMFSTRLVPILPIGASRVYRERLVLTAKTDSSYTNNDAGSTQHYTLDDASDVLVYKNGVIIANGTDWDFVADGHATGLTNISPGNGSPMKRGIYLTSEPNILDIITVSYTPKVSNTHIIPSETTILDVVDLTGDRSIRVVKDNAVVFAESKDTFPVSKADIYLVIIMRRNSADPNLSPAVEEFLMATSSRDLEKFNE